MINAKITDIPVPVTRTEHFMYSAITGNESGLKADTQAEMYLDAIKNSDTSDLEGLEPRTVLDMYLEARQTGVVDDLPKPRTTSEMLLYQAITGEDLGAKPVSNMDKYLSLLEPNNYDARLEVESEESIIHLTDSKNGVVEVKELEGNTLVNYCTDGSKELTLNGDIDVEGTNVTTPEGVDNGLVDVALEGNTLVNCSLDFSGYTLESDPNNPNRHLRVSRGKSVFLYKENTVYTICLNVTENTITGYSNIRPIDNYQSVYTQTLSLKQGETGRFKLRITTKSGEDFKNTSLGLNSLVNNPNGSEISGRLVVEDIIILEGDWTNKEIPQYFEGMKSVAEFEDNKLEIVSTTKNLFTGWQKGGITQEGAEDDGSADVRTDFIKVKPNTYYTCSNDGIERLTHFAFYDREKQFIHCTERSNPPSTYKTPNNCTYVRLFGASNLRDKFQLEIGEVITSYSNIGLFNKKEITLSEPLRALPNGVKDKIVKVGGKWYVERNCGYTYLNTYEWKSNDNGRGTQLITSIAPNNMKYGISSNNNQILNNKITNIIRSSASTGKIIVHTGIEDFYESLTWLLNLNISIIYELATPTYEELPIEPTLNTYTDTTHISNNSTIPCDMKIKNTGYNAIIKPSTQYTVAFDSNASGEVGINLGGSKVTTTNNVATVTTPSTLVDDSLRLTGKGIKASKVRLLEGDKTNWIPSYFEGMKSSFEDKLQDDGTYKMEVLSNNGNLFNFEFLTLVRNNYALPLKYLEVDKTYTVKTNSNAWFKVADHLDSGQFSYQIVNKDTFTFKMTRPMKNQYLFINNKDITPIKDINVLKNLQPNIRLGNSITSLIENKSNKIQLSLLEPLRGVGDVKDRFVFKDGKLMIERNCGEVVLDGSENWQDRWNSGYGIEKHHIFHIKIQGMKKEHGISDMFTYGSLLSLSGECVLFREGGEGEFGINIKTSRLTSEDVDGFKQWLQANLTTVVYPLVTPTYEEITPELQKLILRCYDNATLFFDTNIPPKSLISYTANTSNIYKYLDTLKLSKAERDSIINSMERV